MMGEVGPVITVTTPLEGERPGGVDAGNPSVTMGLRNCRLAACREARCRGRRRCARGPGRQHPPRGPTAAHEGEVGLGHPRPRATECTASRIFW